MRRLVQALAAFAQNGYLAFPWTRNIYQGKAKLLCAPGLNCHSCPAALYSCPIGTMQHFFAGARGAVRWASWQLGFSVLGFLMLLGVLGGRFACGWLCPFGFLQELLHKIPAPKFRLPRPLGHLRYLVLAVLVVGLPLLLSKATIPGDAWFCKLLCPAGTLEAGGLLAITPELREQLGQAYLVKFVILAATLLLAIFTFRPWCRALCPLGLIYGFFNRVSFVGLKFDRPRCEECRSCVAYCKVGLDPREADPDPACLRCLGCATKACPTGALSYRLGGASGAKKLPSRPI